MVLNFSILCPASHFTKEPVSHQGRIKPSTFSMNNVYMYRHSCYIFIIYGEFALTVGNDETEQNRHVTLRGLTVDPSWTNGQEATDSAPCSNIK